MSCTNGYIVSAFSILRFVLLSTCNAVFAIARMSRSELQLSYANWTIDSTIARTIRCNVSAWTRVAFVMLLSLTRSSIRSTWSFSAFELVLANHDWVDKLLGISTTIRLQFYCQSTKNVFVSLSGTSNMKSLLLCIKTLAELTHFACLHCSDWLNNGFVSLDKKNELRQKTYSTSLRWLH